MRRRNRAILWRALATAGLATSGCSDAFGDRDAPAAETLPASVARHEALARRVRNSPADLLLIGDSITEAWPADLLAPHDVLNLGVGGDTVQNVRWRLEQYDLPSAHPRWAVLMIGTNNLGKDAPADIARQTQQILRTLRLRLPRTRLAVIGVLPRGPAVNAFRKEIADVNAATTSWARANGVVTIDVAHDVSCGGTVPGCTNYRPDQLHLLRPGYEVLSAAVKRVVDVR
jgi:lysophospholipase L1-like esterase